MLPSPEEVNDRFARSKGFASSAGDDQDQALEGCYESPPEWRGGQGEGSEPGDL